MGYKCDYQFTTSDCSPRGAWKSQTPNIIDPIWRRRLPVALITLSVSLLSPMLPNGALPLDARTQATQRPRP